MGAPCTVRPMSRAGYLHSEVECIMGNGHMGPSPPKHNDKQVPVKTFLSANLLGGQEQFKPFPYSYLTHYVQWDKVPLITCAFSEQI